MAGNAQRKVFGRGISRLVLALMLAASWLVMYGCAAAPVKEELPELYWPFPPERPRIKFLDIVIGSLDATGERADKFKAAVFGVEGESRFGKPEYVFAKDRTVYVTDLGRVHILDFGKKQYSTIGSGNLTSSTGIAVNSEGSIFVGDSGRKRVLVFTPGTAEPAVFGNPEDFGRPSGIAVDNKEKHVLIADTVKHAVFVYDYAGTRLFTIGGRGREPGKFNFPYDLTVGKDGRIYVLDSGNFRVQMFDSTGKFLRAFGGVGSEPGTFARPKGIALDSEGHIYVVDAAFANFQIFDEFGQVLLSVGSNGTEPGMFILPFGIAIDDTDKIYVVDQINKRMQVFQYIKYDDEKQPSDQQPAVQPPATQQPAVQQPTDGQDQENENP